MPAGSPTVLGPYRIERELGRGGMGIVYLAHDPRLGRRVAIKALPDDVAADPDRLARFEREARILASLNHPNLAAVYDVLEVEGRRYLAMEYVEGESLADRLRRGGALPLREALDVGRQIAAGMEAAHEGGVIHRDLKPANVMITRGDEVKVVDFGLAKERGDHATESPPQGHAVSPVLPDSSTQSAGTDPGRILGTAEYLSPEQARGKMVDRRADIWAFGCVLYECLTGGRLFSGATASETIARVLERPIDWGTLPKGTPPRVRELLERCLERDAHHRLRDVGDARLILEGSLISAGTVPDTAPRRARLRRVLAALVGTVGVIALAWYFFGRPYIARVRGPAPRTTHLSLVLPAEIAVEGALISPDGSTVVVRARPRSPSGGASGDLRLYRKRLDDSRFESVSGTERVVRYGFTPDGKSLVFTASTGEESDVRLLRVPLDGSAPPVAIAAWQPSWTNAAALASGDLIVGMGPNHYLRLQPGSVVTRANSVKPFGLSDTSLLVMPYASLPRDRGVLLTTAKYGEGGYHAGIGVLDLKSGRSRVLVEDGGSPTYAATGHLLFTRHETLLAVPFDLKELETRGDPVAIMDGLHVSAAWNNAGFALSRDGTLLYRPSVTASDVRSLMALAARLP